MLPCGLFQPISHPLQGLEKAVHKPDTNIMTTMACCSKERRSEYVRQGMLKANFLWGTRDRSLQDLEQEGEESSSWKARRTAPLPQQQLRQLCAVLKELLQGTGLWMQGGTIASGTQSCALALIQHSLQPLCALTAHSGCTWAVQPPAAMDICPYCNMSLAQETFRAKPVLLFVPTHTHPLKKKMQTRCSEIGPWAQRGRPGCRHRVSGAEVPLVVK